MKNNVFLLRQTIKLVVLSIQGPIVLEFTLQNLVKTALQQQIYNATENMCCNTRLSLRRDGCRQASGLEGRLTAASIVIISRYYTPVGEAGIRLIKQRIFAYKYMYNVRQYQWQSY